MNRSRVVVLGLAAFAAIAAAFLVRGLLGGGTEKSAAAVPPPMATAQVLVAAQNIPAGTKLTPASVRWQEWPKSAVDSSFIAQQGAPDVSKIVAGAVARAPLVAGEPLSTAKIVHAESAGFMAAQLSDGMRAVSIAISAESGAGGFILPNDRVDVMLTRVISTSPKRVSASTILSDVRVLAVDQTFDPTKSDKTVIGKTATLELSPAEAETVARSSATGTLSLSLRALGDNAAPGAVASASGAPGGSVSVIRYGISRGGTGETEE